MNLKLKRHINLLSGILFIFIIGQQDMYALFINVNFAISSKNISLYTQEFPSRIHYCLMLVDLLCFNASENGLVWPFHTHIPSFNKESSVNTDSFTWKQMLRTVFMTSYQNWQMHKFFSSPGSQWSFKWIIDWKTEKWNVAWVNVIAILASFFQKPGSHWR